MKGKALYIVLFLFGAFFADAQVSEIKSASSNAPKTGNNGGEKGSRSSGTLAYFFVDLMLNGVVEWQRHKLSRVEANPSLISVEVMGQVTAQSSVYYVAHPRIRGNWGLFSTDFRLNYLVEEDINGFQDLTTYDWQIIQLNIITSKHVTGRVGFGMMKENFGDYLTFAENTCGLQWYTNHRRINGVLEYRSAVDWKVGFAPRREFNTFLEARVWQKGYAHLYATAGLVYQRYYNAIDVWGLQGGLIFKLHRPTY